MAKTGMLIDLDYCVGCYACQSACQDYFNLPLEETYLKTINTKPHEVDGEMKMFMAAIPYKLERCDECLEKEGVAPCQSICLSDSIFVGKVDELLDKAKELGTRTMLYMPAPE